MISPARRVGRTMKLPNRRQFEEARVELNALSAEELVNPGKSPRKKSIDWCCRQNVNIRAFLHRRRRRFLRSLDSKQDSSKPSKPPASRLGCLFDLLVNSPVSPTQFLEDHSANPTCLAVSPANLILPFGPFDEGSVTHDTAQRFRKGLSASSSDLLTGGSLRLVRGTVRPFGRTAKSLSAPMVPRAPPQSPQ